MNKGLRSQLGEIDVGKIKTSISIDEELWKKFNITVIQKEGGRKLSDVIETLIEKYIKDNNRGK